MVPTAYFPFFKGNLGSGEKWGFLDKTGRVAIEPTYDYAHNFLNSCACVKVGKAHWYIAKSGETILKIPFETASSFRDGRAIVGNDDGMGVIDRKGTFITNVGAHYWYAGFSEGLSAFFDRTSEGRRYGYIGIDGRVVVAPKWTSSASFSEGFAAVESNNDDGNQWGYVDRSGELVIPQIYSFAAPFSEGLACVGNSKREHGFINRNGDIVIPLRPCIEMGNFSEGLAPVRTEHGVGYIDKSGGYVIEPNPTFSKGYEFVEGLAIVEDSDSHLVGFIDRDCSYVISAQFFTAESFSSGLAWVQFGLDKAGYVNRAGELIWNSEA